MNDNLPQLEQALYTIKTLRTVLQWISSHSGVHGNEQADRLAKHGAGQQQQENPVCLTEMKTINKSLFKTPQQQDSYHQLTRSDQTTIFRLRTGHNRLNQHLNSHENHTIPDVLLWRDRARYCPHFTDMQEPSDIERRDMAITNNIPGEALWTRECPTEDHQIRSGN